MALLRRAARTVGTWPREVVLRHTEFADAIGAELEAHGCEIEVSPRLPHVDDAARNLVEEVIGPNAWPTRSDPATWTAWGLRRDLIAELFEAHARLYRAAPWMWISERRPIFVEDRAGTTLVGRDSTAVLTVLGAADLQRGFLFYREFTDYEAMMAQAPTRPALTDLDGPVLYLGSTTLDRMPATMRREVMGAGWSVATPDAYPHLLCFQTPGGGITPEVARALIRVIHAVAELTERAGDRLAGAGELEHERDGIVLAVPPESELVAHVLAAIREEMKDEEFEDLDEVNEAVAAHVDRLNSTPRSELSGLDPKHAQRLLDGGFRDDSPLRVATDLQEADLEGARFVHNARVMLHALSSPPGTRATAGGNLNRAFVAQMMDRMAWRENELEVIRDMNKVVNEHDAWGVHVTRLVLELAKLVRRRKGHFTATRAGVDLAAPAAAGRLAASLFRTFFGTFNLAYLDGIPEDSRLQYVAPLTLWRIGVEGRSWQSPEALADHVLPPELRRVESSACPLDTGAVRFELRIVEPLLGFGLLEERPAVSDARPLGKHVIEVRVTPLFDRMIRFEWEGAS
jgi:hypothetical protein